MKFVRLALCLAALSTGGVPLCAETLRAVDVIGATNVDWMALARAQRKFRAGESVEFVLPTHPACSYAEIRRAVWLAGLHGLLNQKSPDDSVRRLMSGELAALQQRLYVPFAFDIAVRDVPAAEKLLPMLIGAQAACLLVGSNETTRLATTLRCHRGEVISEPSGVAFMSLSMAVSFSQACHTENGLVFEADGSVATNLFVRRFLNRTATVVNLTGDLRRDLVYRQGTSRQAFDLMPFGVTHLLRSDPPRLTRNCGERFTTILWKVRFDGKRPQRLVKSSMLPTVVDENYTGPVSYRTEVIVPPGDEALLLHLDTGGAETTVLMDGHPVGTRAWEPFEWLVPADCRGKSVPLEIRIEKRSIAGFLQSEPCWHRL